MEDRFRFQLPVLAGIHLGCGKFLAPRRPLRFRNCGGGSLSRHAVCLQATRPLFEFYPENLVAQVLTVKIRLLLEDPWVGNQKPKQHKVWESFSCTQASVQHLDQWQTQLHE